MPPNKITFLGVVGRWISDDWDLKEALGLFLECSQETWDITYPVTEYTEKGNPIGRCPGICCNGNLHTGRDLGLDFFLISLIVTGKTREHPI